VKKTHFFAYVGITVPLLGTIAFYNKSHKVTKLSNQEASIMESAIATLIVVSVIVLSVFLANYIKESSSDSKSQKKNDFFTFTLPFIVTLVIGIAVIPDFMYLPVAITAALIAGVLSLMVSWTAEKKEKEAKQKKNNLFVMHIYMFPRNMRSAV